LTEPNFQRSKWSFVATMLPIAGGGLAATESAVVYVRSTIIECRR